MERSDSYGISSFRGNNYSIWNNSAVDVFSKSSIEEDDEEALKWAALEKLPTYNRLRKGVLAGLEEKDNENFLSKLKDRLDRVGINIPTIEVRYEHVNVDAEAYVGSRSLPTILNFYANILEGFLSNLHILPSRKKPLSILHEVSGIIKPDKPLKMTLLLGSPSSGKTILLMSLAGMLDRDLKFSGRITYNGHGMDEFVPQKTAAYISQQDLHIGEMTVRETLAFSARCQGVGARYETLAELLRREKEANIKPDADLDIYMKAKELC
ncbi:pleiotropic drug resistance protein 1-like [Macadamia integrifolia]|uniref:pleiotropic drug resistance protein 1-like n=1 Tax=Macadamia integrifolia TaxID=60698 RepID=UPI001C4EB0C1|nr:pleiotropic drug resistance protein 1-like [Macadamia integrifolia]